MVSWVKKAAAGVVALVLLAGPAAAQVPDPFARELAQRLSRAESLLTENGYARAAGPFAGGLENRRARQFNVMLRAGQDYRIVGVCESRCSDLDLRLFDPNNQMIGEDTLQDSVPIIHVMPRVTGQHTIEVAMYECRSEPCWYAFNVYSR
jgi:hypothetical protein